jgi:hypothetical protein
MAKRRDLKMDERIKYKASVLAEYRNKVEKIAEEKSELWNKLMQTEEGKRWLEADEALQEATNLETVTEKELRDEAVWAYQQTGLKDFGCGVGIRMMRRVEFDNADALAWCIAQGNEALLEVDETKFKRYVRAVEGIVDVPVAKIYEEAIATISAELEV